MKLCNDCDKVEAEPDGSGLCADCKFIAFCFEEGVPEEGIQ